MYKSDTNPKQQILLTLNQRCTMLKICFSYCFTLYLYRRETDWLDNSV